MSNMVINTNVLALNAHRSMKVVGQDMAKASRRLSSGLRINSAADDAAGLAISEKMRAQIRGLDQASQNAQDAISLFQSAEGGLQEIDNMLQRIRELTVKAANDTNEHNDIGTGDRQKIQDEMNQLVQEIDSMADRVEFNRKRVISGDFANPSEALTQRQTLETVRGLERAQVASVLSTRADTQAAAELALGAFETTNTNYVTYTGAITTFETKSDELDESYDTFINNVDFGDFMATISSDSSADYFDDNYTGGTNKASLISYFTTHSAEMATAISTEGGGAGTNATDFLAKVDAFNNANTALHTATLNWANDANGKAELQSLKKNVEASTSGYEAGVKDLAIADARLAQAENLVDLAQAASDNAIDPRNLHFQIGANAYQNLITNIGTIKSDLLGIGNGLGYATIDVLHDSGEDITGYLDTLDYALSYVTSERSKLGAAQNRLEYTIRSLDVSSENISASESRIRDADMAAEMMNFVKSNVLQQAAISMLTQANQSPQNILQLLRT